MRRRLTVLLLACFFTSLLGAQTNGSLSVSVTTSSAGGNYAPKNIVAIWVEDSAGKYVKTLLAYADKRKQHLNTWETATNNAGSIYNSVDAITGATKSSHATRTCTWNGTDYNKKAVPDGDYKIRMELTDKNATGNLASFTITKGPNVQKLTPANAASFSAISLNWTVTTTGITSDFTKSNSVVVYPNPGSGQFTVLADDIMSIEVKDLTGKTIILSRMPEINLSGKSNGIYLFLIRTSKGTSVQKVVKQ